MIPTRPSTFATALWQTRGLVLALAFVVAAALAMTLGAAIADAAPTTFTVTNTGDEGEGSLRDAIEDANANDNTTEQDTIEFDIQSGCDATSGVCTISPTSELPTITEPVIIDGYTQTGASANTLATGNDAQLKIELSGANVEGRADGLRIGAPNSVIKGLIINRWTFDGIVVDAASGNTIEGNFVGTDASGTEDLGNGSHGVSIDIAPNNVVGGTSPAARNLISGNADDGVIVFAAEASGNTIQGNYIGTDASGTEDLGNDFAGVDIFRAPGNVVGGTSARARNVISGNEGDGVTVFDTEAGGNEVRGNYIGTDASGTEDLGNGDDGVLVARTTNTAVGGTSTAAANTVAFNGGDGVEIDEDEATGNSVLRNSIYDNAELGIDLEGGTENASGVTANDPQDPDPGANLLQNFPVITSATTPNGRSINVQGTLNSNPNESFTIQFFSSPTRDPSGYGEGKTFLGQTNVTANAGGNAVFSFSTQAPVSAGEFVTATATNAATGDTSEFSRAVGVRDETRPTVVSTNPTNRATGVPARADVFATFSEAMNPSTINPNTFKLFLEVGNNQTLVPSSVSYNEEVRRGRLDPDANLTPGATYVATVTTRARDLAGNQLDQDPSTPGNQQKVWRFTVAR